MHKNIESIYPKRVLIEIVMNSQLFIFEKVVSNINEEKILDLQIDRLKANKLRSDKN
ncbi:hypothetical protein [Bacillus cereus]|uniref:hypothetical protein n=1 Tax=Bacillus cereus TaxID=1396 RepID=UPI001F1A6721|nr:hypothetical protein [Bacillus cereus]BCB35589.1 hypothetical protein BCM0045_0484 [Bacillus cereus]BCB98398.1 hypothetical protein BCM0057_0481 [Bacillus cereus]BCC21891.1 hypothetical protein BCM0079_0484 [Bacillus cereus]BCC33502.1 hypothetical protein BCM0105_0492 [Bacillus cereus]